MNAANIIAYYDSLLGTLTSKTKTSVTLTDFSKTTDLSGTFTVPTDWDDEDIKFCVLIFTDGYCRVIDTVSIHDGTATVSWRQPLDSFITITTSPSLSALPMANVAQYVGANQDRPRALSLSITEQTESDWAMSNKKKLTSKLVVTYDYSIVGDSDYKANYLNFLYGLDQIESVIVTDAICSYRARKTGVRILQTPDKDERLNKTIDKFKAILSFDIETYNR